MAYVKNIVCLANSTKLHPGRCIAGRELCSDGSFGEWIRPIGDRPTAEVLPKEFMYEDDSSPRLLEVMAIPLLEPVPHDHQVENHLIDTSRRWKRVNVIPFARLPELREKRASLWINNHATDTIEGFYNCLTPEEAATQKYSLTLIRPSTCVAIVTSSTWEGRTKKKFFSRFKYNHVDYTLSLTDPAVTDLLLHKEAGEYPLENVDLCVSLAEPNPKEQRRRCSKLVASVFSESPLPLR
jgi:hypothetical protein